MYELDITGIVTSICYIISQTLGFSYPIDLTNPRFRSPKGEPSKIDLSTIYGSNDNGSNNESI